jgi:hypothetical protein
MSSSNIGDGNNLGEYFQQPPQNAITAFLAKLWALVNDISCDELIAWDPSGNSFHVYDQSRFAREILPRYFKHNNFASFIRQLNMYGFRKISNIEHGSLKNERDDIEFAHPSFIRGQDTMLEFIKRRAPENQPKANLQSIKIEPPTPISSSSLLTSTLAPPPPTTTTIKTSTAAVAPKSSSLLSTTHHLETQPVRSMEFGNLLADVRTLKSKQSSLSDKLFHLEDENQSLWREISLLRQKHAKQQKIVSKLMEFLLHILTSSTQNHRRSVGQPLSTKSQQEQTSHPTIDIDPLSNHNLKRKPAALMHSEIPNKRSNQHHYRQQQKEQEQKEEQQQQQKQQQQHQQNHNLFTPSISINGHEQQPTIIINELTDTDAGNWHQTTNTSPLIDLVPSPQPLSNIQYYDDKCSTSKNYEWIVSADELANDLQLPTTQGHSELGTMDTNLNDSCLPDFFLTTDHDTDDIVIHPNNDSTLTDINTVNIDADLFF